MESRSVFFGISGVPCDLTKSSKEMQLRAIACVFLCVLLGGACAEETAVDKFAAVVAAEPEDKVPRCTIYASFRFL